MPRVAQSAPDASLTPAITISLKEFAENQLPYPRECYKDEYFRVVQGVDEHYKALRTGWSDTPNPITDYKPWSASPEMVAMAQKQQQAAIEAKKLQEKLAMPANTVNVDQVQAMIDAALAKQKQELLGE